MSNVDFHARISLSKWMSLKIDEYIENAGNKRLITIMERETVANRWRKEEKRRDGKK